MHGKSNVLLVLSAIPGLPQADRKADSTVLRILASTLVWCLPDRLWYPCFMILSNASSVMWSTTFHSKSILVIVPANSADWLQRFEHFPEQGSQCLPQTQISLVVSRKAQSPTE